MKTYLSLLLTTVFLTACNQPNNTTSSAPASAPTAASASAYVVASQLTYPPFHFRAEKDTPTGFEIELIQAVAKAEGLNINIQNTPRNALEQTLNDNTVQIWASTVSVSPERSEKMDFSKPFMYRDREILVILDNAENKNVQGTEHLQNKKVAINKFSRTGQDTVAKITGDKTNAVVSESYYASMNKLFNNEVQAVLDNELVLSHFLKSNPNVPATRSIVVKDETKNYAFAVKKGNTELLNKINAGLDKVKSDGTYQQLVDKWFGNTENVKVTFTEPK